MISSDELPSRTPPKPEDHRDTEGRTSERFGSEMSKFVRRAFEAVWAHFRELERAGDDKFDEVKVLSEGHLVEVEVPHSLGVTPHRMITCLPPRGPWVCYRSRNSLGDDSKIYVGTNAPRGAAFIVRIYPMNPVEGSAGPNVPIDIEDTVEEEPTSSISAQTGGKVKKQDKIPSY